MQVTRCTHLVADQIKASRCRQMVRGRMPHFKDDSSSKSIVGIWSDVKQGPTANEEEGRWRPGPENTAGGTGGGDGDVACTGTAVLESKRDIIYHDMLLLLPPPRPLVIMLLPAVALGIAEGFP